MSLNLFQNVIAGALLPGNPFNDPLIPKLSQCIVHNIFSKLTGTCYFLGSPINLLQFLNHLGLLRRYGPQMRAHFIFNFFINKVF